MEGAKLSKMSISKGQGELPISSNKEIYLLPKKRPLCELWLGLTMS